MSFDKQRAKQICDAATVPYAHPTCNALGCTNLSDPRYCVRTPDGDSAPICDGHGVAPELKDVWSRWPLSSYEIDRESRTLLPAALARVEELEAALREAIDIGRWFDTGYRSHEHMTARERLTALGAKP